MNRLQKQVRYVLFLVVIGCSICTQVYAQSDKENIFSNSSFTLRYNYGWIWGHRPFIEHLAVAHTQGFEIAWFKQTTGKLSWEKTYNYPQTGYIFLYNDFAYPKALGSANALMTFINFPLVRSKSILFSFRTAAGLGYLTKKYERIENYKNNAISSHFDVALQLSSSIAVHVSKRVLVNFGFGITHFSNGAWSMPNLGLNNPVWNAGVIYQLNETPQFLSPEIPTLDKHLQLDAFYAAGLKQVHYPDGKRYFAHTLSSTLLKPLSHKSNLGIGPDIFYDLGRHEEFKQVKVIENNKSEIIRAGIHVGYELKLNHLSMIMQMGIYALDAHRIDGFFYHRFGLKYQINNHLFANFTLKTHFAKADYAEFGMGWKFLKSK